MSRNQLKSRADDNAFSSDSCIIHSLCDTMTAFTEELVKRARALDLPDSADINETEESFLLTELDSQKTQGLAEAAEQLLGMLNWCAERLKTLDTCQRQLDLAIEISMVVSKKKVDYYKVETWFC